MYSPQGSLLVLWIPQLVFILSSMKKVFFHPKTFAKLEKSWNKLAIQPERKGSYFVSLQCKQKPTDEGIKATIDKGT